MMRRTLPITTLGTVADYDLEQTLAHTSAGICSVVVNALRLNGKVQKRRLADAALRKFLQPFFLKNYVLVHGTPTTELVHKALNDASQIELENWEKVCKFHTFLVAFSVEVISDLRGAAPVNRRAQEGGLRRERLTYDGAQQDQNGIGSSNPLPNPDSSWRGGAFSGLSGGRLVGFSDSLEPELDGRGSVWSGRA